MKYLNPVLSDTIFQSSVSVICIDVSENRKMGNHSAKLHNPLTQKEKDGLSFLSPKSIANILLESASRNKNHMGFFTIDCFGKNNPDHYKYLSETLFLWLDVAFEMIEYIHHGRYSLMLLKFPENGSSIMILFRPTLYPYKTVQEYNILKCFLWTMEQSILCTNFTYEDVWYKLQLTKQQTVRQLVGVDVDEQRIKQTIEILTQPYLKKPVDIHCNSKLTKTIYQSLTQFEVAKFTEFNRTKLFIDNNNLTESQLQVKISLYDKPHTHMRISSMVWAVPPYDL